MELFTKAQQQQLKKNGSDENPDKDHAPVIKLLMTGTNFTWLISEINCLPVCC